MQTEALIPQKTNRSRSETYSVGGKGINVSLMLKALGEDSTAIYTSAGFTGNEIKRILGNNGIKSITVECEGFTRINVKLPDGTEINGNGPELSESEMSQITEKISLLKETDILAFCGKASPENTERICAAVKKTGARLIADTSGKALLTALAYKPFLIKPNIDELREL